MGTSSIDITPVTDQATVGVGAVKALLAMFGGKGIEVALAVIAAGLVIFFIYWGFHKGKKALNGK